MLTVVLGLVSSVFLIIICCMMVYICKSKKKRSSNLDRASPNSMGSNNNTTMKNYLTYGSFNGEAYNTRSELMYQPNHELPLHSSAETLNQTALNPLNPNHRSSRLSLATVSRVSPAAINVHGLPPTQRRHRHQGSTTDEDSISPMSSSAGKPRSPRLQQQQHLLREAIFGENIVGARDMVRIEWPRNSIPRRVKKLSWEDENGEVHDREISTLTDPNVSVTPMNIRTDSNPQLLGRSVYF